MALTTRTCILDLEDSVDRDSAEQALINVEQWVASNPQRTVIRISKPLTTGSLDEAERVAALGVPIMLPKVDSTHDIDHVLDVRGAGQPIIAIIETPEGLENVTTIASHPRVARLAYGSYDLAATLGIDPTDQVAHLYGRSRLVVASGAAKIAGPLDGVVGDFLDGEFLVAETRHARSLGYTGKLSIHPSQVALINREMAPSSVQIEWAKRVLAAYEDSDGVVASEGEMIDAPVAARARRILSIVATSVTPSDQAPN